MRPSLLEQGYRLLGNNLLENRADVDYYRKAVFNLCISLSLPHVYYPSFTY